MTELRDPTPVRTAGYWQSAARPSKVRLSTHHNIMVASLGSVLAPAAHSPQMSAMHSRPAPLQSSTSSLGCLTPFSAQRRSQQLRASRIKTVVTTAGYKVHHIYLPHSRCRLIAAARLSFRLCMRRSSKATPAAHNVMRACKRLCCGDATTCCACDAGTLQCRRGLAVPLACSSVYGASPTVKALLPEAVQACFAVYRS